MQRLAGRLARRLALLWTRSPRTSPADADADADAERARPTFHSDAGGALFPREVWARICMLLDVPDVLALSECNRFLHGVCNSPYVWEHLTREYFLECTDDGSVAAPPFAALERVTDEDQGDCPVCKNPLRVQGDDPVWRLPCSHVFHHSCLQNMRDTVAMPSCWVCEEPLHTGDESAGDEACEQVLSRRLIAQHQQRWAADGGVQDWKAEFRSVYLGGGGVARDTVVGAVRGSLATCALGALMSALWALLVLAASGALGGWCWRVLLAGTMLLAVKVPASLPLLLLLAHWLQISLQEIEDALVLLRRRGDVGFGVWKRLRTWFLFVDNAIALVLGVVMLALGGLFLWNLLSWPPDSDRIVGWAMVMAAALTAFAVHRQWAPGSIAMTVGLGLVGVPIAKLLVVDWLIPRFLW